jgi:hypothetical protein
MAYGEGRGGGGGSGPGQSPTRWSAQGAWKREEEEEEEEEEEAGLASLAPLLSQRACANFEVP